jgi:hypothetical protein
MDWLPGIVGGALAGAGSGLLAALVAPWAEWGIEQRRSTRDRRAAAITHWRASIRDLRAAESGYLARKAEDEKTGLPKRPFRPRLTWRSGCGFRLYKLSFPTRQRSTLNGCGDYR